MSRGGCVRCVGNPGGSVSGLEKEVHVGANVGTETDTGVWGICHTVCNDGGLSAMYLFWVGTYYYLGMYVMCFLSITLLHQWLLSPTYIIQRCHVYRRDCSRTPLLQLQEQV